MSYREEQVYSIISETAASNTSLQGLSGLLGFPWTSIVDISSIFTHYGPMINQIRGLYGRSSVTSEDLSHVMRGCGSEIMSDMVFDKVLGQLPIIGMGANMLCARAMTWRLGILFAMLSANGEHIDRTIVIKCARLIRKSFPESDLIRFRKPSCATVNRLIAGAGAYTQAGIDVRIVCLPDSAAAN